MNIHTAARFALVAIAAALALTGCATGVTAAPVTPLSAGDSVTIADSWVKAADEGMSAAFGELRNSGETDVTIVSAATEASAAVELHETVEDGTGAMVMREKDLGFTIPAGGSLVLAPGGNHLMLMGLTGPLTAGQEATVTLTFSDDSTYEFTASAKDYAGANESYEGGDMDSEMDMGE